MKNKLTMTVEHGENCENCGRASGPVLLFTRNARRDEKQNLWVPICEDCLLLAITRLQAYNAKSAPEITT